MTGDGVTVLVPWRDDGSEDRRRALAHVVDHWGTAARCSVVRVVEAPPGPWRKGAAVREGLDDTTAIHVVADADVIPDEFAYRRAVHEVASGRHLWATPHTFVRRLTPEATASLYAGAPVEGRATEEYHRATVGGGLVVAAARVLRDVPIDPRFEGWGGEDWAWGKALRALAGDGWRGQSVLTHLWHPPQERRNRRLGSKANETLRARYRMAHTVDDVEAVVAEARRWWHPSNYDARRG